MEAGSPIGLLLALTYAGGWSQEDPISESWTQESPTSSTWTQQIPII